MVDALSGLLTPPKEKSEEEEEKQEKHGGTSHQRRDRIHEFAARPHSLRCFPAAGKVRQAGGEVRPLAQVLVSSACLEDGLIAGLHQLVCDQTAP